MDPLIQRLNVAAQDGSIEEVYAVIGEKPDVLEEIDKKQFVQTPLHIAASAGRAHFAIEIMNLRPSFGRKLNPSGKSPLHLAVPLSLPVLPTPDQIETEKRQTETAIRLINIDSELIRVQGRDMMTPLHYAAERDKFDLVAEFLCACPASIEHLTIRGETAMHVAVRNSSLKTFQVLLGWYRKVENNMWKNPSLLSWKNEDGDTLLHIAASSNQSQIVKLLIKRRVNMNEKNLEGWTALDSGYNHQEVKDILMGAGASGGVSVSNSNKGFAYHYIRMANIILRTEAARLESVSDSTSLADFMRGLVLVTLARGLSEEMRKVVQVVAVLIATATFQVPHNPPSTGHPFKYVVSHPFKFTINLSFPTLLQILVVFNSLAFFTSIGVIAYTLRSGFVNQVLQVCLFFLTLTYIFLVATLQPSPGEHHVAFIASFVMFVLLYLIIFRKILQSRWENRTFSVLSKARFNPSRFYDMRNQMVDWL
ncbi:ankyrin repeat-containing protein BDA1-like [Cornus florida]|uniref:ankyrin repeat-containing protein BDA1-like n=1 Tax=Cornus florida TaxID=4283 RepID=UPI0028962FE9|nr:ankyrin repeat-containing protein BDA1-like [Cornus florida]